MSGEEVLRPHPSVLDNAELLSLAWLSLLCRFVVAQTELLCCFFRYQLQSQEETKERRHSHTIGGLPESDDQAELPSPPALSMSLSAKGQLTNIGQCLWSLAMARDEAGITLQSGAKQLGMLGSMCGGLLHGASVYQPALKMKCSKVLN